MPPFEQAVTRHEVVARIQRHALGDEPEAMRANFETLVSGAERSDERREAESAEPVRWGIDGLLWAPVEADENRWAVIWLHGGGYVFGSPETHWRPARWLGERLQAPVFLSRYRRAPEHPWPAPLDDALAAVQHVQQAGQRVVLVGDSAGGHLALVTALEQAKRSQPVDALVLFSPNTDRTGLSTTRQQNDPLDPMVSNADDRRLAAMTFGDLPDDHPHVSPVVDDLSLLPPTYVEAGSEEVLLGDSLVLHRRAQSQGAPITLHVEPGLLHMAQLWTPWWPAASASLERAVAFLLVQ